ncbi:unnamed protein product [Penicillium egyptiacum]|uniref:Carboxylic ester hydrolase n=1 Tax=Penicillium egyptiacum TaxID=1303716 RepID=A0A9W4K9M5_9EURO|nr:unnamed protein product [Penicillium egyptiacum]
MQFDTMVLAIATAIFTLGFGVGATGSKPGCPVGPLPTVDLGYAVHQATINSSGIPTYSFNNIRYAEPPTGELRFRAPIPPKSVNRTVNNGQNDVICPQASPAWLGVQSQMLAGVPASALVNKSHPENANINISSIPSPDSTVSEDCLFLDVMVPTSVYNNRYKKKGTSCSNPPALRFFIRDVNFLSRAVPVLVWIYGGGYISGSKTITGSPDGLIARAKGGMIYVAMNYRLGVYGYLSGPTFQVDGEANAGFYDQELALQWVQKYISKFGGDPDRVTIMGESAGGGSVMHQITAYGGLKGKVPFNQAIAQSPGQFPVTSNAQLDNVLLLTFKYASLVSGTNVTTLQQLRRLSARDLYNTNYLVNYLAPYGTFPYGPAVDGKFVPKFPAELLAHGQYPKGLNVMVGHNLNEGAMFANPFVFAESDFAAVIKTAFPDADEAAIDHIANTMYPPVFDGSYGYTTQFGRMSLLTGDRAFTCPTRWLNLAFNNKTFAYYFTMSPGYHGVDVPYTFFNGDTSTLDQGYPVNATVAYALQDYITSFTMTGSPNAVVQPFFPIYGANSSTQVLSLENLGTQVTDTAANYRCDWWQKSLFY